MNEITLKIIYWIATGSIGLIVTVGASVIKKWLSGHDEKEKELEEKIEDVDRRFQDYKLEVSKNYVSKDEFLRVTSRHDQKLDKILDRITELAERMGNK